MESLINLVRVYMDYTIVDLSHDFSGRTLAALESSDKIIFCAQQDIHAIKSVQKSL